MSKTITLSLKKSLIFEAVKAESFDTGRIDKSADPVKNAAGVAVEQAGGEAHQERQLLRSLKQAIGKFEAQMGEFLDAASGSISNTLSTTDSFTITMAVNDRYNNGMANPMASLCEDFLISSMLFTWWNSRKQDFAKTYLLTAQDDIDHIRLCLCKAAPENSQSGYEDVNGAVTGSKPSTVEYIKEYTAILGTPFEAPSVDTVPFDLPVTYSSSDEDIAEVDEHGNVTLVDTGTVVITATFAGNDEYLPSSGSYKLTIIEPTNP